MNTPQRPPLPPNQPPPIPRSQPPVIPRKPAPEFVKVAGYSVPKKFVQMTKADRRLTKTGIFLAGLTAIVTLAFALFVVFRLLPAVFPQGGVYPVLAVVIPVVGLGAAFFACGAWVTGKLGFPAAQPKE